MTEKIEDLETILKKVKEENYESERTVRELKEEK